MSTPTDWTNATIVARRVVNARCLVIHVRPDTGHVQPVLPGQFVQLGLPRLDVPPTPEGRVRLVKRSYSLASAPHETEAYELCLAMVETGQLTPRLWPLQVGDRLWCDDAPKGHFTLERLPADAPLVCCATGTGIAPFVAMLRAARHAGVSRRFVMIHGVREPSDLAYDDELRGAGCTYIPLCTRAGADWQGLHGRVQVALTRWHEINPELSDLPLDPQHAHVLLCGNPAMIDEVRDLLALRGYTLDTAKAPGTLHFERYW